MELILEFIMKKNKIISFSVLALLFCSTHAFAHYPYVQIENDTGVPLAGTVHYLSALCSNDHYDLNAAVGSKWKASSRGVCLVTKIDVKNTITGKSGTPYTSTGTSYSQFAAVMHNGKLQITRLTS